MDVNGLISSLVVGALAGWIAGKLARGKGFGCVGNIIVGVIGAVLGSFAFGLVGLSAHSLLGTTISAVIGALILLWCLARIRK